jgi:hypothetical protein
MVVKDWIKRRLKVGDLIVLRENPQIPDSFKGMQTNIGMGWKEELYELVDIDLKEGDDQSYPSITIKGRKEIVEDWKRSMSDPIDWRVVVYGIMNFKRVFKTSLGFGMNLAPQIWPERDK